MTSYQEHYQRAERLRLQHDAALALREYELALGLGGPDDRHIKQMIGVCFQMLQLYDEAIPYYQEAFEGAEPVEQGNILRDMAASYAGMGDFEAARRAIDDSLLLLEGHRVEHAATLGTLGRINMLEGDTGSAVMNLEVAVATLHYEHNRHIELYKTLDLARALSQNGQWLESRVKAAHCLPLAKLYGGKPHLLSALALLIGGYKFEEFTRKLLRK